MSDAPLLETTDALRRGLDGARRRGASAARILLSRREAISASFEAGRLRSNDAERRQGFEVHAIVEGRSAVARGTRLDQVDDVVERACRLAPRGSDVHFDAYPPAKPTATVTRHDPATAGLSREELIDACWRYVDRLRAHDDALHILANASRREVRDVLVTTGGVCQSLRSTTWRLSGGVQRTVGTDIFFAGHGRSWRALDERFDPEALAARTIEQLQRAAGEAEPVSGRLWAVLAPEVLERFLQAVEMGVNGRNVARGASPLAGRLGERVLDEAITLIDDPHGQYVPGATPISDEGVPTARTTVIDGGVLRTFLYDLDSAGLAGASPTGHDGCQLLAPLVEPGQASLGDLLGQIDDGVYVEQLLGFGQGNLINGDFSCNVGRGYRVRDGAFAGRLKNTMVSGNVYDLLGSGVRIARDVDPCLRLPYVVVEGIDVSSAGC